MAASKWLRIGASAGALALVGGFAKSAVVSGVEGGKESGEGRWVRFGGARMLDLVDGSVLNMDGPPSTGEVMPFGGARTGAARTLDGD